MVWGVFRSRDERGASAVEYGLLLAGIAAIIVGGIFFFGGAVSSLFDQTCGAIENEGQFGMLCSENP